MSQPSLAQQEAMAAQAMALATTELEYRVELLNRSVHTRHATRHATFSNLI